jgi:hypothetical protein
MAPGALCYHEMSVSRKGTLPSLGSDTVDLDRIRQNALFGALLKTRFMVQLKAHVLLPAGLDVFIYSGRETDVAVDQTALAAVLAGRFQFLDTLF